MSTLVLLTVNNYTGNNSMETLTNLDSSLQQLTASKEILIKNCWFPPSKIGTVSSNGNYQDLYNFLECTFLAEGGEGLRNLDTNQKTIEKKIPQLVGLMSMFGDYNRIEEADAVAQEALDNTQHIMQKNVLSPENISIILLKQNDTIDIKKKYSSIQLAQIDILPLTTEHFTDEQLKRISQNMKNNKKIKDKSYQFGNDKFIQYTTLLSIRNNPITNIKYTENQNKKDNTISSGKIHIKKKLDQNPISGKKNGITHYVGCMFNTTPCISINPNRSLKVIIDSSTAQFQIQNECYKNRPNKMSYKSCGDTEMYCVLNNLIGHECVSLGKFIENSQEINSLAELIQINFPMRNNSLKKTSKHIENFNFRQQIIEGIQDISRDKELKPQISIYAFDDPKTLILHNKFAKTLHTTYVNFERNSLEKNKKDNIQIVDARYQTGQIKDLISIEPNAKQKLYDEYFLEEIKIQYDLLDFDKTVVIPFYSVGSQLVVNAPHKNIKTNEVTTENSQTSLLMPGAYFFVIKKSIDSYGEYVSLICIPTLITNFEGIKSILSRDGLSETEFDMLKADKKILEDLSRNINATQFSKSSSFKSNKPSCVSYKTFVTDNMNYCLTPSRLIQTYSNSQSHINNLHVLETESDKIPKRNSFASDLITMIPLNIKKSQIPSQAKNLPLTDLDGNVTNAPSSILAMHIIENIKYNSKFDSLTVYKKDSLEDCFRKDHEECEKIKEKIKQGYSSVKFSHTDKFGTIVNLSNSRLDSNYICNLDSNTERMHCSATRENEDMIDKQDGIKFNLVKNLTNETNIAEVFKLTFGIRDTKEIAKIVTDLGALKRSPLSPSVIPIGVGYKNLNSCCMYDEQFNFDYSSIIVLPSIYSVQSLVTLYPMVRKTQIDTDNEISSFMQQKIEPIHNKEFSRTLDLQKLYNISTELTSQAILNSQFAHNILFLSKIARQICRLISVKGECYDMIVNQIEYMSEVSENTKINYNMSDWDTLMTANLSNVKSHNQTNEIIKFLNYGLPGFLKQSLTGTERSVEYFIITIIIMTIIYDMITVITKLTKIRQENLFVDPKEIEKRINSIWNRIGIQQSKNMLMFMLGTGMKENINAILKFINDTLYLLTQVPKDQLEEITKHVKSSIIYSILSPEIKTRGIDKKHENTRKSKIKNPIENKTKRSKFFDSPFISGKSRLSDLITHMNHKDGVYLERTRKLLIDMKTICEAIVEGSISQLILEDQLNKMFL